MAEDIVIVEKGELNYVEPPATTNTAPKPIEKIENLGLLQTDLIAFIIKETGIDMSEHDSPNVPAFNAEDIALNPMSVMAKAFSRILSTNILDGAHTGMYPAVVALPFKSGPGGVQSCKAIVPTLHSNADNPFAATDEDERADMISHFPTFSFNDGLSEASSPLVPGSIILVSFDNPHNYWSSGVIEKVIKGRPDALPEYASFIEGVLEIFNDPMKWLTAALFGEPITPFTDTQNCKYPRDAQAIFEAYKSVGSQFMNIEIANKIVAVANSLRMKDPGWLANLIHFETARSFNPAEVNNIGATGLIQFTKTTAGNLGTTTEKLALMSSVEQLDWVEKYFKSVGGVNLDSQADVFAAVFFPAAVGKGPNFSIYDYNVSKHSVEYANETSAKNNGMKIMGQYTSKALAAAKLTCPEDL